MNLGPFGFWELIVIAALVLLLFGPRKLPEMARGLSNAVREFRKGLNEASRDLQEEFREAEAAGSRDREPEQAQAAAPPPARLPPEPDEETLHR